MKKEICIITNGYPTKEDPVYAFIQPLAREMADAGVACTVIAPQSITNQAKLHKQKRPYCWIDVTEHGNEIVIYQPEFISCSNLKLFGTNISTQLRDAAIERCFRKEKLHPGVLYAHFWDCGIAAGRISPINHIPVYVATGESKIRVQDYYSQGKIDKYLPQIKGVIAVSTKNLEESRNLDLLRFAPKTCVLPNAINPNEFYCMPKEDARRVLGFASNEKIVIFVGAFCHRKGVLRVVEAVEKLDGVKLILIGSGEQTPQSDRILFSGKVPHNELVKYLNAADVFALPTLAEGCCNAIVEALACGVPVVSSKLPFNYDILNSGNSIMVNPENITEIAEALNAVLSDNAIRSALVSGAKEIGKELTIHHRCEKLLHEIGFENV